MSLLRPAATRLVSTRAFSTTSPSQASLMFALSSLSNRQETQHFAQQSKLNRVHHSPALEMIRESEVKPFEKQEQEQDSVVEVKKEDTISPSISAHAQAAPSAPILQAPASSSPSPIDATVLQTLQQMSAQLATLEAKLVDMGIETEKDVRRTGALVTVLVAGAVAGLGIWKFWPPESVRGQKEEFANKHFVQERSRVVPADLVGHHAALNSGAAMVEPAVSPVMQTSTTSSPTRASVSSLRDEERGGSWWRSVFWKAS